MKQNKHYSYSRGFLSEGCQRCVQGKKVVLFITGKCPRNCWYCTLGEKKFQKDVMFANERPIHSDKDLLEEVKESGADSAGITRGDPLTEMEKTVKIIKLLKSKFKNFHIHLYTCPDLLTEDKIDQLNEAGLDELRLHPNLEDKKHWEKIKLTKKFKGELGMEIPLIPDFKEQTLELINYVKDHISFLNLNELESADTDNNQVTEKGYKSKDDASYAIKGSEELFKEIITIIPLERVHFCTAKLKDKVQLGKRLKVRAKNVAKPTDIIMPEGSLIRGAIYTEKPSFNYTEQLKKKNKEEEIKKLKKLKAKLCTELRITRDKLHIDDKKYRLLTSRRIISRKADKIKELGYFPAIVEEYPTYDLFEIEIEFL